MEVVMDNIKAIHQPKGWEALKILLPFDPAIPLLEIYPKCTFKMLKNIVKGNAVCQP